MYYIFFVIKFIIIFFLVIRKILKYYLVNVKYLNEYGYLDPYKDERYHFQEF